MKQERMLYGGIKGKSNKLSANFWSRRAWDCN